MSHLAGSYHGDVKVYPPLPLSSFFCVSVVYVCDQGDLYYPQVSIETDTLTGLLSKSNISSFFVSAREGAIKQQMKCKVILLLEHMVSGCILGKLLDLSCTSDSEKSSVHCESEKM